MRLQFRTIGLLLLTCASLILSGAAQPTESHARPPLTVQQVVENLVRMNLERAHALPAYRSTRIYRVQYHGFPSSRSAELVVDVEYAPPNRKDFVIRSATGSKL